MSPGFEGAFGQEFARPSLHRGYAAVAGSPPAAPNGRVAPVPGRVGRGSARSSQADAGPGQPPAPGSAAASRPSHALGGRTPLVHGEGGSSASAGSRTSGDPAPRRNRSGISRRTSNCPPRPSAVTGRSTCRFGAVPSSSSAGRCSYGPLASGRRLDGDAIAGRARVRPPHPGATQCAPGGMHALDRGPRTGPGSAPLPAVGLGGIVREPACRPTAPVVHAASARHPHPAST